MKNKFKSAFFSATIIGYLCMGISVFAAGTLMTYEGWGIRGKASIQSFSLSSDRNVTLTHTNSNFSYNAYGEDVMDVTFQSKGLIWSNTGYKVRTRGNGTSTYSTKLPAGTYRLYFNTAYQGAVADISGNVKG